MPRDLGEINNLKENFTLDNVALYLKDIGRFPLLSPKEEQQLFQRYKNGDLGAHTKIWESNLRLVVSIAKTFRGRGIDFLDAIQEGNIGLNQAIKKFDHQKGFKFSTYATWWIWQQITRALAETTHTIRLPVSVVDSLRQVLEAEQRYVEEFGKPPSPEELANYSGILLREIKKVRKVSRTVSADAIIDEEGDDTLIDFISKGGDSTHRQALGETMSDVLESALANLDDRERQIIELRYGLNGQPSYSLEDVAKKYDLTRERIRQIETKALEKLKGNADLIKVRRIRKHLNHAT